MDVAQELLEITEKMRNVGKMDMLLFLMLKAAETKDINIIVFVESIVKEFKDQQEK